MSDLKKVVTSGDTSKGAKTNVPPAVDVPTTAQPASGAETGKS
jgi:hypothetical protein